MASEPYLGQVVHRIAAAGDAHLCAVIVIQIAAGRGSGESRASAGRGSG